MDAIETRLAKQRLIDARQQISPLRPQMPPFHFPNSEMLWIITSMDPDVVQKTLPQSLRPAPSMTAILGLWHSAAGSPFGEAFGYTLAIEVDGIESPDGLPGLFICEDGVSSQALTAFQAYYNPHSRGIQGSFSREGNSLRADVLLDGQLYLSLGVRGTVLNVGNSGNVTYICQTPTGELTAFPCTWSGSVMDGVIDHLKVGANASELVRAMRIGQAPIVWRFNSLDFTQGTPQLIADSVFERSRSLPIATLIDLLGRPAAIVSRNGQVLAANRNGHELIGEGPLRASGNREQAALSKALEKATQGPSASHSGPLSVTTDERTLLVRIFPLDRSVGDDARALAFLTDPRIVLAGDASVALQLLGLTGAEARLAAVIGGGASGRQAAQALKLSPSTVSSTLRVVYSKLGIRKQSELAKIVTNVSMI